MLCTHTPTRMAPENSGVNMESMASEVDMARGNAVVCEHFNRSTTLYVYVWFCNSCNSFRSSDICGIRSAFDTYRRRFSKPAYENLLFTCALADAKRHMNAHRGMCFDANGASQ